MVGTSGLNPIFGEFWLERPWIGPGCPSELLRDLGAPEELFDLTYIDLYHLGGALCLPEPMMDVREDPSQVTVFI